MENRMRSVAAVLTLSMAGFGLTGRSREIKKTTAKTEAVDKQVRGAQAADTQASGNQAEGGQEGGSQTADSKKYRTTLCLPGATSDMSWYQSAYDGLRLLEADYGCKVTYTENPISDDAEAALTDYMASGHDAVIGHGYEFEDPAMDAAEQYPDTKFIVMEGEVSADSMAPYVLKCEESRYIMGMLAVGMSENGEVGLIGLIQGASFAKIMDRLEDRVKEVNPDTQVQIVWIGSFTDTALGKETTQAVVNNGTDIIGYYANESGTGATNAAKGVKIYAAGDSYDQNDPTPDAIFSSSVYHTLHVAEIAFKTIADGTSEGGISQLGMTDGAVSVAPYHNSDSAVPDKLEQEVSDKIVAIESGTFEVACDTKPRT